MSDLGDAAETPGAAMTRHSEPVLRRGLTAMAVGVTLTSLATMAAASDGPIKPIERPGSAIRKSIPPDAWNFFNRLVERYRSLHRYSEAAEIEQVTEDPATDAPPIRSRTRVRAEVDDGRLTVQSSSIVERVVETIAPDGEEAVLESDLWMLPHLRLRFDDEPLESFRPAAPQSFRPADVDRVRVEDRELVRVDLLSGETGAPDAKFSLYVDPERMLVERVEGDEWLPGGLRHRTTVTIDSHEVHEVRTVEPDVPKVEIDATKDAEPADGGAVEAGGEEAGLGSGAWSSSIG